MKTSLIVVSLYRYSAYDGNINKLPILITTEAYTLQFTHFKVNLQV